MEGLNHIDPYTFTGSAVLIGFLLTGELTLDQLSSVGNWLQLVGLIMQTYASQVDTVQQASKNSEQQDEMTVLKKSIDQIKKQLDKIGKSSSSF